MRCSEARGLEFGVAVVAGVLSFIAAPPRGVQIHWNPDQMDPWRAPTLAYALVVPLLVFAIGRVVVGVVNAGSERAQRPLRIDCAAGVAFVAFASLQRIPDLSVLIALAGAVLAGLAVYSAAGALFTSSSSESDGSAGAT